MDIQLLKSILESKPKFEGKIRKEKWGGLYMIRKTLTMEAVNETAYEILIRCTGEKTVDQIIDEISEYYNISRN